MKVLFVGPEIDGLPALSTWQELDQVGDMDGVTLEVLTGPNVTRSRVASRLSRPYAVVILAGHGKPGKFVVSDGCLTARWLARYVKKAKPQLVLLAACHSVGHSFSTLTSLAEEISAVGIDVIAMPTAVDDNAAVIYDVEFMRAYSGGSRIREAHQIAMEQMETLTNPGQMPLYMPGANANIAEGLGRVVDKVDALAEQFSGVNRRMDRMLDEQGSLAVRMGRLEEGVAGLSGAGRSMKPAQDALYGQPLYTGG